MKDQDFIKNIHDDARMEGIPVMKDDGMDFLISYITCHEDIRDILEVGTAVGYSAIRMASVRWDMTVDTLEIDPEREKQARLNIQKAGLQDRIHCYLINGTDFETKKIYDLVFIDAAKSQYRRYLEHFMKNSRIGTVFVFDNLGFHGMVDQEELTHNRSTIQMVHKIHHFRSYLLQDKRFDTVYMPKTGDGIALSRRIL